MFDVFAVRNNFLFLLSLLVVAFSRDQTRFDPVSHEVIEGDLHIDLRCRLDPLRNESATYRWLRDGYVLASCASCSNGTVNITRFTTEPHWNFSLGRDFHFRILQPSITDAGVYVCTDNHGQEIASDIVKILVSASKPVITTEPNLQNQDLYVTEGQDVVVACRSRGKPAPDVQLKWRNVTMELPFYSNVSRVHRKIFEEDETTARMYFVASRKQEGWKIQCIAHNNISGFQPRQAYIRIYVTYESNLRVLVIPPEAKPGQRAVLICQIDSPSQTNLTWTKDGSNQIWNTMIILENVSSSDAGTYVCTSRNGAEIQRKKASLLVKASSPSKPVVHAGSTILQAVLIFTVLIFLFLLAILAGIVHFICHSAVYNNTGSNKRRLPTLPDAYPTFTNPQRTTIDERSNSQISMKQVNPSSSMASSLPGTLLPPRPQAKLPQLPPFKSQMGDHSEHSYMNTTVTQQPDYLEVVDEKSDKEDLLYEDPDKNCFQSSSRTDTPSSTISSTNTPQILLSWD